MCIAAVGAVEEPLLEAVRSCVVERLGCAAWEGSRLEWPPEAYDPRRGQTNSALVLRRVLDSRPGGAMRILGVTESDLFIPMLTFVFGQAQLNGLAAVISLARLRQEFHGMPPDPDTLVARARKEAMHELGHTFGLIHCPDPFCAMSLSINLPQVDAKYEWYCEGCNRALRERLDEVRKEHDESALEDPGSR